MANQFKYISLFSGCGGLDLGFEQEGFKCIGAYDLDPNVLRVHSNNLKAPVFQCDISDNSFFDHKFENFDVLLAGAPCQGFSTLGKRRFDDPRNNLLLTAGKVAQKFLPNCFVAENVLGVAAGKHKEYWDSLKAILRESNYKVVELKCNGVDMGLPQTRRRLILLGWRTEKNPDFTLDKIPGGNLKNALKGVENKPNHNFIQLIKNSPDYMIAQSIKPGQKLCNVRGGTRSVPTWNIPEVYGQTSSEEKKILVEMQKIRRQRRVRNFGDADPIPCSLLYNSFGSDTIKSLLDKGYIRRINGSCYDLSHTFNGKFRRLTWENPSYTVDTYFGNPRYFLHPEKHRGFSVREAARIQGFPDSFCFDGKINDQFKMIGNAVPPPMARIIAQVIRHRLF